MEIIFKLRIKPEHKPPVFKEGFEKGVLVTQIAEYPDDMDDMTAAISMSCVSSDLKEKYIEVTFEKVIPELKNEHCRLDRKPNNCCLIQCTSFKTCDVCGHYKY